MSLECDGVAGGCWAAREIPSLDSTESRTKIDDKGKKIHKFKILASRFLVAVAGRFNRPA